MSQMVTQFSIHGLDLTFTSTSSDIITPVIQHLQYFLQDKAHLKKSPLTMVFESVGSSADIPVLISSSARKLFSRPVEKAGRRAWTDWPCEIYRDDERLIVNFFPRGLILVDGVRGEVQGYLVNPEKLHPDIRVRFFHLALTELLRWKGFYTIHATALEKNGWGVLIPGSSGRGKTTTFVSLLRSGYRCLSDDHPFLHENGKGLEILAFPVKVDVTENTIGLFPELRKADAVLHRGIRKRYFYVEDLYPGGTANSCLPKVLLFPHVVDRATSWVEPISKSQALEELLPQGLLVFSPEVARQEFQALTRLVQEIDCYRLCFGRDVLEIPRLIDPILERNQG